MNDELRRSIVGHLNGTVDIVLGRVSEKARLFFNSEIVSHGNGTASPFSKILFPQIKLASLVERSFSASIGTSFNYIARDLVRHAYGNGEIEKVIEGDLPTPVVSEIDHIVELYRGEGHRSPDTVTELTRLRAVAASAQPGDGTTHRRVKSDVFFVGHDGVENYVEIKTPMPNYDTCKAVKTRILTINSLRHPTVVRARVAFPHNPNGVLGDYAWPPARYFLDPVEDWAVDGIALMGEGLWNWLGGSRTTYSELLGCCEQVFSQRNVDVAEALNSVTFGAEDF